MHALEGKGQKGFQQPSGIRVFLLLLSNADSHKMDYEIHILKTLDEWHHHHEWYRAMGSFNV